MKGAIALAEREGATNARITVNCSPRCAFIVAFELESHLFGLLPDGFAYRCRSVLAMLAPQPRGTVSFVCQSRKLLQALFQNIAI
ncbi:hypothetical protein [Burkholderia anthina]|uniref:hypothetical protein n=1 Tax=Burkholderia anthina TaxID=179879 RepID=UPI00158C0341|nr:hypothetical protein [Burkholderia anthina]